MRVEQLAAPAPVVAAFAATTRAAVGLIVELNRQIIELEPTLADHFESHPDADIYRSLPGLGVVLGARVLGEFGDDPDRYTTSKSRRNYAGTSPLTIASGKKRGRYSPATSATGVSTTLSTSGRSALCRPVPVPGSSTTSDATPGDLHHQALRALRQPPRRPPPRLPPPPHPLRRTHRLGITAPSGRLDVLRPWDV
nr:hypothetical protein GCM10017611_73080 [Rhodococcus wratislaviensis]